MPERNKQAARGGILLVVACAAGGPTGPHATIANRRCERGRSGRTLLPELLEERVGSDRREPFREARQHGRVLHVADHAERVRELARIERDARQSDAGGGAAIVVLKFRSKFPLCRDGAATEQREAKARMNAGKLRFQIERLAVIDRSVVEAALLFLNFRAQSYKEDQKSRCAFVSMAPASSARCK